MFHIFYVPKLTYDIGLQRNARCVKDHIFTFFWTLPLVLTLTFIFTFMCIPSIEIHA